MHLDLKKYALYYHSLNLNVIKIGNNINMYNINENNILKSPDHHYQEMFLHRQTIKDIEELDWHSATGVGVVLGFNNIVAIDIDGVLDFDFIKDICKQLGFSEKYKWIMKSGSKCGYHILMKCDKLRTGNYESFSSGAIVAYESLQIEGMTGYDFPILFGSIDTNAYFPKRNNLCIKIEFKWIGNLVLPPSLHSSGMEYKFINGQPNKGPENVDFGLLASLKEEFCTISTQSSVFDDDDDDVYIHHSYQVTRSDEHEYNFENKKIERSLLFTVEKFSLQIPIKSSTNEEVSNFCQLSWLVIGKNDNVLKRKVYTFVSTLNEDKKTFKDISFEKIDKLITNRRYALMEFLFDLDHVKNIICFDSSAIKNIKQEITNSGLYVDGFFIDNYSHHTKEPKKIIMLCKSIEYEKEMFFDIPSMYERLCNTKADNETNACITSLMMYQCYLKLYPTLFDLDDIL